MLGNVRRRGADLGDQMTLFPFLFASACSIVTPMALMIWLTSGFGGIFWIMYGHAQIWYFSVVAVAIMVALCCAHYFQLRAPAIIVSCILGGYVGSIFAYSGFAFHLIVRSVSAGDYLLLVRPFIFPYHLTFVLAGLGTGLLMLAVRRVVSKAAED